MFHASNSSIRTDSGTILRGETPFPTQHSSTTVIMHLPHWCLRCSARIYPRHGRDGVKTGGMEFAECAPEFVLKISLFVNTGGGSYATRFLNDHIRWFDS